MNSPATQSNIRQLDVLQKGALTLMAGMALLTFVGSNLQALLWQSSDWLVGTVLPAVVVDLTNDERSGVAAVPLQRNTTLDAAATAKAEHMARNGYFAHFAPDGTSPWYFFDQAGYTYAHAGENLAIHFTDSAEVVAAWMNSPAHKENIVNGQFTEIGVGTARGTFDGYETVFVVQLFGTPAVPVATVPTPQPVVTPAPAVDSTTLADLRAQVVELQARATELQTAEMEEIPLTELDPETLSAAPETTSDQVVATAAEEVIAVVPEEVLVVSTELATSSGLVAVELGELSELYDDRYAGATAAAIVTRPGLVLDVVYSLLASAVVVLLSISLLGEARRLHYMQAAYSLALLAVVGSLWFAHTLLTSGAVIA